MTRQKSENFYQKLLSHNEQSLFEELLLNIRQTLDPDEQSSPFSLQELTFKKGHC